MTIGRPRRPADQAGLLAAKVSIPHLPPGLVARPRLLARLDAAIGSRATLISAGPGWGKTFLAAQWAHMATPTRHVAWVSLDPEDNNPTLFWSYVLAALRASGGIPSGHPLAEMVPAGTRMDDEQLRHVAVGAASLPEPVTLILDDLHEIQDEQVIHGIASLLRHDSALRLVLVTRRDPHLGLHRLRVLGELGEIRAIDLAFSSTEATSLIRAADLDVTTDQERVLLDRTDGWVTGLRLAVMFAASGPGMAQRIEGFAGDVSSVAEYLLEEVLSAQPVELRQFLLRTSIVERVRADLADVLTDGTRGQQTLEELEHANAFVVALGPRHSWYRYHPLLADLLRHQLGLEEPEVVPVLHARAAHWFAANGATLEAVRHAALAHDWQLIGHLVVTQAWPQVLTAQRQAFGDVLAMIPPVELSTSAQLRTCGALQSFAAHDYARLAGDLAQARALLNGLDTAQRAPIEVVLHLLDMAVARTAGDMPALTSAANDVLAALPRIPPGDMPAADMCRPAALTNLGVGQFWSARADMAEASLEDALASSKELGLELPALNALSYLALYYALLGRLEDASRTVHTALDLADRRGWTMLAQNLATYLALAVINLHRSDPAEARRAVQLGITAQRTDREPVAQAALDIIHARVQLAAGHMGAALAATARARQARGGRTPRLLDTWLAVAEAETQLMLGRPDAALERLGDAERNDFGGEKRLLAARAHLARGETEVADRLARSLLDPDAPHVGPAAVVEAWVVTALVADRERADHRASEALAQALSLAETETIHRPFVALDPDRLPALLRRQQHLHPDRYAFTAALLGLMEPETRVGTASAPLAAGLTERELAVLEQLATLQSNSEIAADLFVSVNTVKAHARSVYRKLKVANRREAVVRARELGLI